MSRGKSCSSVGSVNMEFYITTLFYLLLSGRPLSFTEREKRSVPRTAINRRPAVEGEERKMQMSVSGVGEAVYTIHYVAL